MAHLARDKTRLIARVRRIGGQVASLEKALAAETECGAVLQQLAAVRGAVNGLMLQVLEGHVREHVAAKGANAREIEPVVAVLKRYLR